MAAEGRWEHLSSERLLKTPYFTLRADRMRLPDGSVKDPYYVIEHPDAAVVLPVTREGCVILVRQYRPPLGLEELGLPAGLLEPGEEPETAARRELLEETGYGDGVWEPLGRVASSPSLKDSWAHLFLARGVRKLSEAPDLDEHERLTVESVPIGEAERLVLSGEIFSSSGVAATLLALRRLQGSSPR